MRLYADHPDRRGSQIIHDITGILWCVGSVVLGRVVYDAIQGLIEPANRVQRTGTSLASGLDTAANSTSGIPFVGDNLSGALERAANAAGGLRDAGTNAASYIDSSSIIIGLLVPILLLLLAVTYWIKPRLGWVREFNDARTALGLADGVELLAARSTAKVRLPHLAQYGERLVQRWKTGDDDAAAAMARAECDRLGLDYEPLTISGDAG